MDTGLSLLQIVRKLDKYVYNLPSVRKLNTLSRQEQKLIQELTQNSSLARAQVEYSLGDEDFEARAKGLKLASEELQTVIDKILEASQYELVSTIEVIHLTANAELCIDRIKKLQSTNNGEL